MHSVPWGMQPAEKLETSNSWAMMRFSMGVAVATAVARLRSVMASILAVGWKMEDSNMSLGLPGICGSRQSLDAFIFKMCAHVCGLLPLFVPVPR